MTDTSMSGDTLVRPLILERVRIRSSRKRSRHTRFKHWVRRHKALSTLIVVALLLLALLIAWLIHLNRQLGEIDRFPLDLDRDGRPAQGIGVNILRLGLDDNDYLDDVGDRKSTRLNSSH